MVDTRRLTALAALIEAKLRLPDRPLVVALSGGADSGALAYLITRGGHAVRAIHVHHGLAASDRLESAARDVASYLQLEIEVIGVSVPAGSSPEGQARTARYRAFLESARGEAVLLAHTRDDQAETVLMNLLRGSGLRGLAGISWLRPPNVYRPMLDVARSETRELATLAGLPFFDDPMNESLELTRNAIRLEVLPQLARFNPQVVTSLARLAENVRAESELIEREAAQVGVTHEPYAAKVAVGSLTTVDPALAHRVLSGLIGRFREHAALSGEEMDRVWDVVIGTSARTELSGGLTAQRSGPMLVFTPGSTEMPADRVQLSPGRHRLGRAVFEVQAVDSVCQVAPLGTSAAIFDPGVTLVASEREGGLVVEADGTLAWEPWVKRHPVAWYEPKTTGYLSVLATEEIGWTSSR